VISAKGGSENGRRLGAKNGLLSVVDMAPKPTQGLLASPDEAGPNM
jgi:hypothetical protein